MSDLQNNFEIEILYPCRDDDETENGRAESQLYYYVDPYGGKRWSL